ncbi:MAG TPA: hypothetical protein VGJ93_15205 [Desulfuromonadaceae bacterium]|jgi:hypothetical protein
MKIKMMISAVLLLIAAGCGGGGGGGAVNPANPSGKVSLSGEVTFPTSSAKRTLAVVPAVTPHMEVFDLSGKSVATPSLTLTAGETYSYSGLQLDGDVDYVIIITRDAHKLRKLVTKDKMVGTAAVVNINSITTSAVIILEQKLNLASNALGTPASSNSSASIQDMLPANLEAEISSAVTAVDNLAKANLVNCYNVVVAAILANFDPANYINGTLATATPVNAIIYTVTNGAVSSSNVAVTKMFKINSSVLGNGTISCQSPIANGGSSVCTITPAPGYNLSNLTDDGINVTSSVSGTSYTISGINKDHTIIATFTTAYTSATLKIDVQNLMPGVSVGGLKFSFALPTGVSPAVLSADVITGAVTNATSSVTGVNGSLSYAEYANSLVSIGIVSVTGFGAGEFMTFNCLIAPGSPITPASFPTHADILSAINTGSIQITGLTLPITVTLQ